MKWVNDFGILQNLLWWKIRLLTVHQQLLDEKSERIYKEIQTLIGEIETATTEPEKLTLHYVHYLTEIASFYDKYYDITRAKEKLEKVLFRDVIDP